MKKKLALFFTFDVSLKLWQKVGLLDREKLIYEQLLKKEVFDQIYWFTYGSDDNKYSNLLTSGITIVPMPKIFNFKLGKVLYSLLLPLIHRSKLKKITVLKTNQMSGGWSALISKYLYKKKMVLRCGYNQLSFLEKQKGVFFRKTFFLAWEKIAYKLADAIILTSNNDKKYIINKFSVNSKKINVLPNYIDISLFKPFQVKKEVDLIFIGRLKEQKNLFNLLEAIKETHYTLRIIGEGPLEKKLQEKINHQKINAEIKPRIKNNKIPQELNKARFFILPSLYEGMPKSLLEAMSCAIPCIGTNVKGINEVIKDKKNGLLSKIDPESLKKTIIFLAKDLSLQKTISKGARENIIQNYSIEKIILKESILYKNL